MKPRTSVAAGVVAALYMSAVLWVTLRPVPWATDGNEERLGILDPSAWWDAASWSEGRPAEVALNVVLFFPLGAFAAMLLPRWRGRILIPVALTLAIELAQIPLDRISHPRDLVANALGAVLGVAVVALVRRARRTPSPDERGRSSLLRREAA